MAISGWSRRLNSGMVGSVVMAKTPKKSARDELPQKEAEERRDAILKRMLNTPPKPKKGKGRGNVQSAKEKPSR